jgi:hypothetical protein
VAKPMIANRLPSAPMSKPTPVPTYMAWSLMPYIIALESTRIGLAWFDSLMTLGKPASRVTAPEEIPDAIATNVIPIRRPQCSS